MKDTLTLKIAVQDSDNLKRLPTVNDSTGERYFAATVNARTLLSEASILDEWKGVNPRDVALDSQACRAMEESLSNTPKEFVYLNKGLLILAKSLDFDQVNKAIKLNLTDKGLHGLVDGGHTFAVLKNYLLQNPDENNINVRIDFIVGIEDRNRAIDIASARNTSSQVKELSIMNMERKFDRIKESLKEYGKIIAYKENDSDDKEADKPVSVRDVIAYMMCFDIDAYPVHKLEAQPITVYSGKASTLKKYNEKHVDLSSKYGGILPVIVLLRDEIYKEFPTISPKLKKLKNESNDKPVLVEGKKSRELYFLRDDTKYTVFDGLYFPVLASFRALIVENNGIASFSQDPIALFHRIKEEFAPAILIGLEESNNNPQTFGKKKSVWASCLEVVKRNSEEI